MSKVFLRYVHATNEVIDAVLCYAAVHEIHPITVEDALGITFGRVMDLDKLEVRIDGLSEEELYNLPIRQDVYCITNPELGFPPSYPACIAITHGTRSQSSDSDEHLYISNVVPAAAS